MYIYRFKCQCNETKCDQINDIYIIPNVWSDDKVLPTLLSVDSQLRSCRKALGSHLMC